MRAKLSPSFTSGRMKMYFPMIMDIVKDLLNILEPKAHLQEIVDTKVLYLYKYIFDKYIYLHILTAVYP